MVNELFFQLADHSTGAIDVVSFLGPGSPVEDSPSVSTTCVVVEEKENIECV